MSARVDLDSPAPAPAATTERLQLSDAEFDQLRRRVETELGISLSDTKRLMLETRLLRRLRELALPSITSYCRYLDSEEGRVREAPHFLDLVTTNKTSFFREPVQLTTLGEGVLADKLLAAEAERRTLRVWSAACSSGQEVWTLAMMLHHLRERVGVRVDFTVLGSDVSGRVLKTAIAAKYPAEELGEVPSEYRHYFMHSKDGRGVMRLAPELRETAAFFHQNLMDPSYGVGEPVDVVLLRNALIYFPRERQQQIVSRVSRHVRADGHFVVGLTESLHGFPGSFQHLGHSIYQLEQTE